MHKEMGMHVPIKFCLQQQVVDQIWLADCCPEVTNGERPKVACQLGRKCKDIQL